MTAALAGKILLTVFVLAVLYGIWLMWRELLAWDESLHDYEGDLDAPNGGGADWNTITRTTDEGEE